MKLKLLYNAKMIWSRINPNVLFVFLFFVVSGFYYSVDLFKSGPLSTHLWRQTDCLSFVQNYYTKNTPLLEPHLHSLGAEDFSSGKTAGEFPLLYYVVAQIWNLTGPSYFSYRLLNYLIMFAALFAFFRTLFLLFKSKIWALLITFFLFSSPVLASYGVSFLTDVPAFSFVLLALYFFTVYIQKQKLYVFYLSMLFFALAGLFKATMLIPFVFLAGIYVLELLPVRTLGDSKLFKKPLIEWTGFLMVVVFVAFWYLFADKYNTTYGFWFTHNNIWPIWEVSKENFTAYAGSFFKYNIYNFFSIPLLILMFFMGIANLFLYKKIPLLAYLCGLLIPLGCILYFVLWGAAMNVHEYYFISMLIIFPGIIIPFLYYLKQFHIKKYNSMLSKSILIIFLIYNLAYCFSLVKIKSGVNNKHLKGIVGNSYLTNLLIYFNYDTKENWYRFADIKEYNRSIGIKETDKVISLPDSSPNISLYLMDQRGWTNYFFLINNSPLIDEIISKGAKYLFVSDPLLLNESFIQPYIQDQAGEFKGIYIYRLNENSSVN